MRSPSRRGKRWVKTVATNSANSVGLGVAQSSRVAFSPYPGLGELGLEVHDGAGQRAGDAVDHLHATHDHLAELVD